MCVHSPYKLRALKDLQWLCEGWGNLLYGKGARGANKKSYKLKLI